MVDVLFIHPWVASGVENIRGQLLRQGFLGTGYLASSLEGNGISCKIINMQSTDVTISEIIDFIKCNKVKIIGFSISAQLLFDDTVTIVREMREAGITSHITLGGHFPTFMAEKILSKYSDIDSILTGEGEYAFVELYSAIEKYTSLENVSGLVYRTEAQKIKKNSGNNCIKDIDELSFPKREDIKEIQESGNRVSIIASRGCYNNCAFCSIASFYGNGLRRVRSPQNVVKEMEYLYTEYGVSKLRFADDIFYDSSLNSKKWVDEFVELLKQSEIKFDFMIWIRANDANEETLLKLKSVGLTQVFIGIEFATDEALKRYHKMVTVEENERAIMCVEKVKIDLVIGFIFFEPYMSWEGLKESYRWLKNTERYYSDHFFSILRPYIGTPIRKRLEEDKLLRINTEFDYGEFVFDNATVGEFYNDFMKYHDTYLKVDTEILQLMLKEKQYRGYVKDETERKKMTKTIKKVFKEEAELWCDAFGKMIVVYEDVNKQNKIDKLVKETETKAKQLLDKIQSLDSCLEEVKRSGIFIC